MIFLPFVCRNLPGRGLWVVRQAETYVILVGRSAPLPSSTPIGLGPSGRRKEFGPQEYSFQAGLETGSFNPLYLAGVATSAHLLSGGANSYLIWLPLAR